MKVYMKHRPRTMIKRHVINGHMLVELPILTLWPSAQVIVWKVTEDTSLKPACYMYQSSWWMTLSEVTSSCSSLRSWREFEGHAVVLTWATCTKSSWKVAVFTSALSYSVKCNSIWRTASTYVWQHSVPFLSIFAGSFFLLDFCSNYALTTKRPSQSTSPYKHYGSVLEYTYGNKAIRTSAITNCNI